VKTLLLAVLVVAGTACKAKEDQFYATIYPCTTDAECGTSRSGAPMFCFTGRLDDVTHGFCAEHCDPNVQPADKSRACVALNMGTLLWRCHPDPKADDRADCPRGLNCYRTSLFDTQGVCMDVPVCSRNEPCTDAYYATCPADSAPKTGIIGALALDHVNCVHHGCRANTDNSSCRNGEGCLGDVFGSDVADICVPQCDSNLQCPPNYACLRATSGPDAPTLCNPSAVIGNRCVPGSCFVGTCDDSGAGFSVCSLPCSTDKNCEVFNSQGFSYLCADGPGGGHCVTTPPFHGANCLFDADCSSALGEACFFRDANGPTDPGGAMGECRLPCKPDGTCDPRGGVAHTCLGASGGCFPGELGVPCTVASECLNGLTCMDVPIDPADADAGVQTTRICTVPCDVDAGDVAAADAYCDGMASIQNAGTHCGAGFCRQPSVKDGDPCTRDPQCISRRCDPVEQVCLQTGSPPTP